MNHLDPVRRFVEPPVNLDEHLDAMDVNMVTCGGQATIAIVSAITRVLDVPYAEIAASISSRSAGPSTRANIDEFTETTAHAIRTHGGAQRAKAIIVLNPAEPPVIMRDTVLALVNDPGGQRQPASATRSSGWSPRLRPTFLATASSRMCSSPLSRPTSRCRLSPGDSPVTHKVSVFLEVEGAGDHLPVHAGSLDIMTSAALQVAEEMPLGQGLARTAAGVSS